MNTKMIPVSSYYKHMFLLLVFSLQFVHSSYHVYPSSNKQHKRRYLSDSGFKKVKRYLYRKYIEAHKEDQPYSGKYFSNTWAVHVDPPTKEVADRVAKKHGFINIGKIGNIPGHYHFKHIDIAEKRDTIARHKTNLLEQEDNVRYAVQQKILERFKRDEIPTDPYIKDMWYILNTGQASGPAGVDMNIVPVWKNNITGKGVVISVLDDGLDRTHPDLEANYDAQASSDLNDNDNDPSPRDSDPDNCHGTRCAGEAAAVANNGVCGAGVAYNAKIGGVRMLDGQATDALEASALGFRGDHIDIYINCWGPKDDGKTFGKPGPMAAKALRLGAEKGRNNLGSIFVWATGNGGLTDDDCNCDGYTTSIFTISIGCIGDHGLSAYYTEKCSSTLAVTFNGASHKEGHENKMVTTDLYHQCTEEFKGTSASAPLAAGLIALTLEANPKLTWRDVQAVIVTTAQLTSPVDEGWKKNGAGFHFNHKFGFGRLDGLAMVNAAKSWVNLPPQTKCTAASGFDHQDIPRGRSLSVNVPTVACASTSAQVVKVEHVVLTISFVHRRRGDVSIDLMSPKGTWSQMLSTRKYDDSDEGLDEWNFMTVYNWGEDPSGLWKLKITDNPNQDDGVGNLFGSDGDNDVEALEEQVIDTQTKLKKAQWDARRKQEPFFDAPYPTGVRKNNVAYGAKPGEQTETNVNNVDQDRIEYDRSHIPLDRTSPRFNLPEELYSKYASVPRDNVPEEKPSYEQYTVPMKKGTLAVFDEKANDENIDFNTVPGGSNSQYTDDIPPQDDDEDPSREKRDLFEDEKRAIFDYYNNIRKKAAVYGRKKSDKYKKVQVQEEETGVQRVQVNAGYENPRIACESGYNSCSGVVLKWVLTLYGTGEYSNNV